MLTTIVIIAAIVGAVLSIAVIVMLYVVRALVNALANTNSELLAAAMTVDPITKAAFSRRLLEMLQKRGITEGKIGVKKNTPAKKIPDDRPGAYVEERTNA